MQHLPQEQPPDPSPSEVYIPEEPQAYPPQPQVYTSQYPSAMPGQEITRPPMQAQVMMQPMVPGQVMIQPIVPGQEIVIYPNRTQAIVRTTFMAVLLAFLIIYFIGIAFFLGFVIDGPLQARDIVPLTWGTIAMLACVAFPCWITWSMARLIKRTPLLTINRQGITVGRMPMLSGFFISWAEIEAIHTSAFIYKYLCIRPKNQKEFLKRFHPLERFNRLSNSILGIPPLIIPRVFLERPVEEIFYQLYYGYANELYYNRIQLRP